MTSTLVVMSPFRRSLALDLDPFALPHQHTLHQTPVNVDLPGMLLHLLHQDTSKSNGSLHDSPDIQRNPELDLYQPKYIYIHLDATAGKDCNSTDRRYKNTTCLDYILPRVE